MKLLVTGATGFLGRNVLDLLANDERWETHALTRSGPRTDWPDVEWHNADFTNVSSMKVVMGSIRPSHLLNLAWIGGELREQRYNSPLNHTWGATTAKIVDLFRESGGERLVSSGSCLEYGGTPSPWDEHAGTTPDTAYGEGKLAASEAVLMLPEISSAVGRIFFTFGPHEDRRRLVADVITSLLLDTEVALSAGHQTRDYLHTSDVARALITLLGSDGQGVYNIGAGRSWPVAELAEEIGRQLDRQNLLQFGARPSGADTADDMTATTDRIRRLGWTPAFNLETGLADCIDWWRRELKKNGEL
jgi:nucleoside-diphosphate-sugar epimerase